MVERRNFKRVMYTNDIRCNIKEGNEFDDSISHSVNISGGGIRIKPLTELKSDQSLALEIRVPGYAKAIPARGEVKWARDTDRQGTHIAGIQFTDIDAYSRQLILDYVHFA